MKKQFVVVEEEKAEYIVSNPPVFVDGSWFRMFKKFTMRQSSISNAAVKIFLVLTNHVSGEIYTDTHQAVCWPSFAVIAKQSGVRSHNTISRAIQELIDLGYIQDRYFDYPPKTGKHEINIQKVWIYSLGEIEDESAFNRRAKETRIIRRITTHKLVKKFE